MKRASDRAPVRVLVLTFNRTLKGYIEELAKQQFKQDGTLILEVSTFSSWSVSLTGANHIIDHNDARQLIDKFGTALGLEDEFKFEEVQYVLGRFPPDQLSEYVTTRRVGRGALPRMPRSMREALLTEVITPYKNYKAANKIHDWTDLANWLAAKKKASYDVVVVDETQDFSANELRAIMNQLSVAHTVTFVLDTTQRIYARSGFSWSEIGIQVGSENSFKLSSNYRNTRQIASFAAALLADVSTDDDGAIPDFSLAQKDGPVPIVYRGGFPDQLAYVLRYIKESVNLNDESVAFLHPKGGGWFRSIRQALEANELKFVLITRRSNWPQGPENIVLSTMHSAKGLEFDHVIIIGLDGEVVPIGDNEGSEEELDSLTRLRKLVAMAVGRARKQVIVGFKPNDAPAIATYLNNKICQLIDI
jgi:superfamily I DNA/RNA helicase